MRPVVVSAVLLVVLMFRSGSPAPWNPDQMCREKYPVTPCSKNIGEGWFQMGNNRCVKTVRSGGRVTFDQAEAACMKYKYGNAKGHLVSIHSLDELHHVECSMYRLFTGKDHYWIGLRKTTDIDGSLLFQWTDGTPANYGHWAHRQPDFFLFREFCVEMNYWGWGLWNDEACYQGRPYVCAINLW